MVGRVQVLCHRLALVAIVRAPVLVDAEHITLERRVGEKIAVAVGPNCAQQAVARALREHAQQLMRMSCHVGLALVAMKDGLKRDVTLLARADDALHQAVRVAASCDLHKVPKCELCHARLVRRANSPPDVASAS